MLRLAGGRTIRTVGFARDLTIRFSVALRGLGSCSNFLHARTHTRLWMELYTYINDNGLQDSDSVKWGVVFEADVDRH